MDFASLIGYFFTEAVIVTKIKPSGGKFDTSPATLTKLKAANISEAALLAMEAIGLAR